MTAQEAALLDEPEIERHDIELPNIDLIYEDGEPLDSNWHRIQINLLVEVTRRAMSERERTDFFAGGNMFVYFSLAQAQWIATHPPERYRHFRGPDYFFVSGVEGTSDRKAWVVWEEQGRYPDVIVELLSPSTAKIDRTVKKELYERTFRTPEYFWYDPAGDVPRGWRLTGGRYDELKAGEHGRLWSEELGLWLGLWEGEQTGVRAVWLRFYDKEGRLVPTFAEYERQRADSEFDRAEAERRRAEIERQRAEAERQRAETERQRAEAAEAEVARLSARIAELDGT